MYSNQNLPFAPNLGGESALLTRQELVSQFGNLIRYFAGKASRYWGLDQSEIDDIVQISFANLLEPDNVAFDPNRTRASIKSYICGVVQNAARSHARFIRAGGDREHDYGSQENARLLRPTSCQEISDPYDDLEDSIEHEQVTHLASKVLALASIDEMQLIKGLYYQEVMPGELAAAIGVDRTTVIRRLARFTEKVRLTAGLSYYAA